LDVKGREPSGTRPVPAPAPAPCPQPWCSFSLIRLRLTRLSQSYSVGSQPSR
jgi:hypothetical protein